MPFDGAELSIWWALPFVGLLLSIAILPLKFGELWDRHFGKISLFWGLCIVLPMLAYMGFSTTLHEVLDVYLIEYMPFIILLLALFTNPWLGFPVQCVSIFEEFGNSAGDSFLAHMRE